MLKAIPRRISLRISLVLFAGVCVVLALFVNWRRRAHVQQAAVHRLSAAGAFVLYEDEYVVHEGVEVKYGAGRIYASRYSYPPVPPDRDNWVIGTFGVDYVLAVASVDLDTSPEHPSQGELEALANLPELKYFGAHGSDLTDDNLKYLQHHSQIEELRIGWTLISGDGLSHLACLPNLVVLSGPVPRREDPFVSKQGLVAIAECTNLQSLVFRVESDEDLYCLRGMSDLRHLDLVESTITGRGLEYLPAPEQLMGLDLSHADLTEAVNSPLLKMVNLRAIRFSDSPIEDDTVAVLAKLRNLEMISLDDTFVTDNGLSRLRELPRLKELSVTATRVSSEGAAEFRKARPDVRLSANDLEN